MIFAIENGILVSDLDAQGFTLRNVSALSPLPPGIATTLDPRFSDQRIPLDGSVTDAKVASNAAIQQGKLNLNGQIPSTWLGTSATTAAQGNLAEYAANKGQPGGYAPLDGTGKLPAANLPAMAGAGTVTSVGLAMPPQFSVSGPIVSSGTITAGWNSIPNSSWFGNISGISGPPVFYNSPLPSGLIPSLDASKITTGTVATAQLPMAAGVGPAAASGLVPFPGAATGPGVLVTDYLARDMTYRPIPVVPSTYRPTLPLPALIPPMIMPEFGSLQVTPQTSISGVLFFYSFTNATGPFTELSSGSSVNIPPLTTAYFYSARVGYNDSPIANFVNSNPS